MLEIKDLHARVEEHEILAVTSKHRPAVAQKTQPTPVRQAFLTRSLIDDVALTIVEQEAHIQSIHTAVPDFLAQNAHDGAIDGGNSPFDLKSRQAEQ